MPNIPRTLFASLNDSKAEAGTVTARIRPAEQRSLQAETISAQIVFSRSSVLKIKNIWRCIVTHPEFIHRAKVTSVTELPTN